MHTLPHGLHPLPTHLDIETQGVAVVALGTNEFPAFFTPASGCAAPLRVDTPAQCAQMIDAAHRLRLDSGMVFAVPIPTAQAAEAAPLQLAQDRAIAEAVAQKVGGRDVTPFLLARVNELTHGKSLVANIALIKNNARIGAQIAASHAAIKRARLSAEIAAAKRPLTVRLPGQSCRSFRLVAFSARLVLIYQSFSAFCIPPTRPMIRHAVVGDCRARVGLYYCCFFPGARVRDWR